MIVLRRNKKFQTEYHKKFCHGKTIQKIGPTT